MVEEEEEVTATRQASLLGGRCHQQMFRRLLFKPYDQGHATLKGAIISPFARSPYNDTFTVSSQR